ncbi:MAG: MutS-related protein, partial [Candidatus Bipolaricaulia bacterium]
LKEDEHLVILTGPNMSGKSVFIRQIALIALMAQIGSFVPAREALLPIIDKIFTRVGASDMLASGYSTFMVEMLETANILNNATQRSLIILDEMGRGTSTFDGVSIAWAVAEHLATKVKAKTLFATHYHELTKLADRTRGVKNMHVRVKEFGNEVIFLHRVAEGVAEGSYGVHVARLAGLPSEVTEKAAQILDQILKNNPLDAMGELRSREPRFLKQLALFAAEEHPVIKRLKGLDLDKLTPLEALELLAELKRELG